MRLITRRLPFWLLAACLLALAVPSTATAQDDEDRFEAVIGDALRAYNEGDYEKALDLYFEAKVLQDLPEIDYSIARAYHQIGKCEAAAKFYDKVLSRVEDLPEGWEDKVNGYIAELPETCIPKEEPKEEPKVVEVKPDPVQPQPQPQPPVDEGGIDWLSWGIIGGGVVVMGAGLGVDLGSASLVDDHEKYTTDPSTGTDAERQAKLSELEDDISTRSAVAIALYGVGGAAIVTGTVLLIIRMQDSDEGTADWTVAPTLAEDNAGVLFRATF